MPYNRPQDAEDLRSIVEAIKNERLDEVAPAEQHARREESRANWGQIGDQFASAFAPKPVDSSYWDTVRQNARQGVADAEKRAAFNHQATTDARTIQADDKARALEARKRDPNSPNATAIRNFYSGFLGDKAKNLGLDTMNEEQLGQLHLADLAKEYAAKDAKNNPQKDAAELAKIEAETRRANAEAVRAGREPDHTADTAREERFKLMEDRLKLQQDAREPYGFHDLVQGKHNVLAPQQKTELESAAAAHDALIEKLNEARELIKGGIPMGDVGTQGARLKQLVTEMYPLSLSAGGYGNMTQGHQHLLQDAVSKTDFDWKNLINPQRLPSMLDEVERSTRNGLRMRAHSMGRERDAETAPAAPAAAGGDIVMVQPPPAQPGQPPPKPVPVHRSKLDAALAAGGKMVNGQ